MYIQYEDWNPRPETQWLVANIIDVLDAFTADGYTLTLRQLYYQLVGKGIIENTNASYKKLGNIVSNARMAGMISWTAIEDRHRNRHSYFMNEDDSYVCDYMPKLISYDYWARQDYYVEVWVEKEALGNVIERACKDRFVPHLACKGYLSASEAWRAGRRFKRKLEQGKRAVIIHLGDHDPSGIDMTRDNDERIATFSESYNVEVRRLALNMNQVEEYAPPPNPAKETDSRSDGYVKKYGTSSWELDALAPSVIEGMVRSEIEDLIDPEEWDIVRAQEDEHKQWWEKFGDNWGVIKEFVNTL